MTTQEAKRMGREAFDRGVKCAPALDKAFMEKVFANRSEKVVNAIELLDAWIAGWTWGNLAG